MSLSVATLLAACGGGEVNEPAPAPAETPGTERQGPAGEPTPPTEDAPPSAEDAPPVEAPPGDTPPGDAPPGDALAQADLDDALTRCEADSECALVPVACSTLGIRRDQAEAFRARPQPPAPPDCGAGVAGSLDPLEARCVEGRCLAWSPTTGCEQDAECVYVAGACGMREAVNRASEEAARTRLRRRAAVISCAGGTRSAPARAVCRAGRCELEDLPHPEWRDGCRSPRDCTIVPGPCGGHEVVARRHAREAREAIELQARIGECLEQVVEERPELGCEDRSCVPRWPAPD
ncbi:MAG TPA: hypothetical protein RMH85_23825 [Polyangiaceae bacterium LLY-WYZ-15_(1-7)]|nr:hypothetical protein [Sandaracinus sp.]HJL04955.1 hypothetical protein [Polyangiaceae bacterium LLY-WYZ-15_(1-7)]HJL11526.1 hypothetical protein [Polyangiaceae bacterium LLY-WYZ-15_(1-7)]HJL22882.1 hypothetical protein [Polyangiaceae bacterium LLY-WYZ-15_(1-7)]HJL36862.1 hypothetical protein [Polyangiaceae bacterium LLY-WYZ-15_(1-7)]